MQVLLAAVLMNALLNLLEHGEEAFNRLRPRRATGTLLVALIWGLTVEEDRANALRPLAQFFTSIPYNDRNATHMSRDMPRPFRFPLAAAFLLLAGAARAQTSGQGTTEPTTPPSVDAGVANGIVKQSGSPSVANGVANGVVKMPGAPSVGNGVGNGAVQSSEVQQKTR